MNIENIRKLVEFDPEKIDKALRDSETDQRLGDLALKMAELEYPLAIREHGELLKPGRRCESAR